jgi:hypothetical protein
MVCGRSLVSRFSGDDREQPVGIGPVDRGDRVVPDDLAEAFDRRARSDRRPGGITAADSRTCPPAPSPRRRAHRFTVDPNRFPSRTVTSPAWIPTRTRISIPAGHGSTASSCWNATAAATATTAESNAANTASPSP